MRIYFSVGDSPELVSTILVVQPEGSWDEVGVLPFKLKGSSGYNSRTRCPSLVSTLKVCVLARIVEVAGGGDGPSGLCSPPRRCVNTARIWVVCYPLVWIP